MSTVRSLPRIEIEDKASTGWKLRHLGFIMDENQMNVALTRARRGLILVGTYLGSSSSIQGVSKKK